ncbi:MAG: 1-acyl-sn-glycerol-3-phosphate acyltransferase [Nocardioidaceae bacterium]|nr:1-acyl-sn-glycerol-3-phosphate acyltransferase [Nocardioidaceae bacterium]NUS51999.1 1-acyl-sn-glycerol-3-phosphate acyltransferase [Nocardioidaceae bacterium]
MQERKGWAFGICVLVLEPLLTVLTKRRWKGGENIPAQGGVVLAANHISHIDPLTFAHFVYAWGRMVRFLAKASVFDVPVVGRVVRSAKQIPVYRMSTDASLSFKAAVEAVQDGECVVVYPEGTITRQPELWPMNGKTGAARIALSSDVPVVPVAQWGANGILAPYAKRPRLFPRKTIAMTAGPPVDLDDLRGQPLTPAVLREATDRIMSDITTLLEEIRGEKAPAERFDMRKAGVRQTGNPNAKRSRKRRGA